MAKLELLKMDDGGRALAFYCPGCKYHHHLRIERGSNNPDGPIWEWNGDMDKPTFSPSLMVNARTDQQCHLFLREGKISFLNDCLHELAGHTVDLEDIADV